MKSLTCVFEQIVIFWDFSENLLEVQEDWTSIICLCCLFLSFLYVFNIFSLHRFWRTNESNEIYKKKGSLCCKEAFWRKEVLKTRGSEADVIRSTLIRNWTSEAEVIRGSEGSEAEDWKLQKIVQMLLLWCLSVQKNRSLEQHLI